MQRLILLNQTKLLFGRVRTKAGCNIKIKICPAGGGKKPKTPSIKINLIKITPVGGKTKHYEL